MHTDSVVKLTDKYDRINEGARRIYIEIDHIVSIESRDEGSCLHLDNGIEYSVLETAEEIMEQIDAREKQWEARSLQASIERRDIFRSKGRFPVEDDESLLAQDMFPGLKPVDH